MKFSEEDIDALINNKPFTLGSCRTQQDATLSCSQEEETMNDNLNTIILGDLNTPKATDGVAAFLAEDDAAFQQVLAAKPVDGTDVDHTDDGFFFITDAPEAEDKPTIH